MDIYLEGSMLEGSMDERAFNQFRADYSVAELEERFRREEAQVRKNEKKN